MPLFGGDGWDSPKLIEIGGEAVEGCFFSNHYSTEDPRPEVQNFVRAYIRKYKEAPDAMAALAYDATRLIVLCLNRMQSEDPALVSALKAGASSDKTAVAKARAKLRDLLAATKEFPGVTGVISLDENRNARKSAVVLQVKDKSYRFMERIAG